MISPALSCGIPPAPISTPLGKPIGRTGGPPALGPYLALVIRSLAVAITVFCAPVGIVETKAPAVVDGKRSAKTLLS